MLVISVASLTLCVWYHGLQVTQMHLEDEKQEPEMRVPWVDPVHRIGVESDTSVKRIVIDAEVWPLEYVQVRRHLANTPYEKRTEGCCYSLTGV